MKEKLLLISLIGLLGSINSYGVKYPYKQLKDEVIEKSAYKDMLKMINEKDRQKGKEGKVIVEDNDKSEATTQASNGMIISNHSYGYATRNQFGQVQLPQHYFFFPAQLPTH